MSTPERPRTLQEQIDATTAAVEESTRRIDALTLRLAVRHDLFTLNERARLELRRSELGEAE